MKKTNARKIGTESAKYMIAASAFTAMLFIWANFSIQDNINGVNINTQPAWIVNLPPIPTVIAPLRNEDMVVSTDPNSSDPPPSLRSVDEPDRKVAAPPSNGPVVFVGGNGGGSGSAPGGGGGGNNGGGGGNSGGGGGNNGGGGSTTQPS